jgi:DNA-binding NarL/FixJ family response regulator
MTIRVVLADDQTLIRSGVRTILATQPDIEVVAEAVDGNEALSSVRWLRPDVVLMDIRMPGVDGLTATRIITADPSARATKVVVLTTYDLDEYLFESLRAGAAGFLLKGISPEDLIRGVREVVEGGSLLSPTATRRLISAYLDRAATPVDGDAVRSVDRLTPRERTVLGLMADGMSNPEIADQLIIGDNTVKTHVTHILTKLAVRDRVQAVIVAHRAGLSG